MHLDVITSNLDVFLEGLLTTLSLLVLSLTSGFVLAIGCAIMRVSKNPLLSGTAWTYSYIFRGTPLLVQLFLIYYGLGQFEAVRNSVVWPVLSQAYWCAYITFTLNTGAYSCEIFAGSIRNLDPGEVEAAQACGMSRTQQLIRIVLPSALRRSLPAYGNEIIFMLHGSAVASVISIVDLTGAARLVNARTYTVFEGFLFAGALYLAVVYVLTRFLKAAEHRWLRHLRPRTA